jgi:hypothetical protein
LKRKATLRAVDRLETERQELAEAISRALPRDGRVEVQPGLILYRHSAPTEPIYGVSDSCFCVIAQGAKHVMLGEDRFRYDPNSYLINTVGLPTVTQIDVASPQEPYLGLVLVLNSAVVTSTMVESGIVQRQNDSSVKAIAVSALDRDLLNACVRLVRLLESPEQYRMIAPLVIREIVCRLLSGEQAHRMRHLATVGGHAHRMVRAVNKLREEFAKPLSFGASRMRCNRKCLRLSALGGIPSSKELPTHCTCFLLDLVDLELTMSPTKEEFDALTTRFATYCD